MEDFKFVEEDYQRFLNECIRFQQECLNTTGCYAFKAKDGEIYYIGSSYNHSIVDRCTRYKQPLNYSTRIMDRGHLWDFVRTFHKVLDGAIRYDLFTKNGQEERKRYYLDYWIENDKDKNDGLINWFKMNQFLFEIVNGSGYLEVILLSKISSKDEEARLIKQYNPRCNMEFRDDENERYLQHEHQREVFWDNVERMWGTRPPEPMRVTYTRFNY